MRFSMPPTVRPRSPGDPGWCSRPALLDGVLLHGCPFSRVLRNDFCFRRSPGKNAGVGRIDGRAEMSQTDMDKKLDELEKEVEELRKKLKGE